MPGMRNKIWIDSRWYSGFRYRKISFEKLQDQLSMGITLRFLIKLNKRNPLTTKDTRNLKERKGFTV